MKTLDNLVKMIFEKYPQIKPVYVSTGTKLAFLITQPLKGLMLHLIVVQGLDPNKPHKKMMEALNRLLDKRDEKPYDDDFDLSWIKRSFHNAKSSLAKNNSKTEEVSLAFYKKATDLSKISDRSNSLSENTAAALETTRSSLVDQYELHPNFDESDPKLDAKFKQTSEFLKRAKEPSITNDPVDVKSLDLNSVKEALQVLKKYAAGDAKTSEKTADKSPKFQGSFKRTSK